MKLNHTIFIVFFVSFLIQFFIIPLVTVSKSSHITNNLGKTYTATIFSLFLVILEVIMHDYQYNVISTKLYALFGGFLVLFIYLYRKQIAIDDKQFVEIMIEHQSLSLLTSQAILRKTNDYNVTKLAKNIIQTQKDQIHIMEQLLNK